MATENLDFSDFEIQMLVLELLGVVDSVAAGCRCGSVDLLHVSGEV